MNTFLATNSRRFIITLVMLAAACSGLRGQSADLRVEVNGRLVRLGSRHQAYLDRGVWMVPARPVLDAARIMADWDTRRQELEVWARYDRLLATVGSYTVIRSNGRREILSRPIAIHHGEPYAPVDFLEMCLGTTAYYDRHNEVLSFGFRLRDYRDGDRDWSRRDRWDTRRYDRDQRWDRRGPLPDSRRQGLTMEFPSIVYGRHVRIEGYWSGESVRLRVTRVDGPDVIRRTILVYDGRWYADLSLSPGEYRVVAEGYAGPFVRQRLERNLSVR